MIQQEYNERYHRQVALKELGPEGQRKLLAARVLVIGAGGLGCPALQYLAAAGVGTLGIIDDDTVALSNLHRQILYTVADIGMPKAEVAAQKLHYLNPGVSIHAYSQRITNKNALEMLRLYDIVIDGTDNFASRYLINDACVLLDKPLIYAAISRYEGQVAVFNVANTAGEKIHYRHLFAQPPAPGEVLDCETAGVLGVLPGIIGTIQAGEAIKLITGIGTPLIGQVFTYNTLTNQVYTLQLTAGKKEKDWMPATETAFREMDYDWRCGTAPVKEIDYELFNKMLQQEEVTVIDVREPGEAPEITAFTHVCIPLSQLEAQAATIRGATIICFCLSGKRSRVAAGILQRLHSKADHIFSLQHGIRGWLAQQKRTL